MHVHRGTEHQQHLKASGGPLPGVASTPPGRAPLLQQTTGGLTPHWFTASVRPQDYVRSWVWAFRGYNRDTEVFPKELLPWWTLNSSLGLPSKTIAWLLKWLNQTSPWTHFSSAHSHTIKTLKSCLQPTSPTWALIPTPPPLKMHLLECLLPNPRLTLRFSGNLPSLQHLSPPSNPSCPNTWQEMSLVPCWPWLPSQPLLRWPDLQRLHCQALSLLATAREPLGLGTFAVARPGSFLPPHPC